MTKYTSLRKQRPTPRSEAPHPIWRGIGCIMIVVVPLVSLALAILTTQIAINQNWPVPYQLEGHPVMPAILFNVNIFVPILVFIQDQNNFYAVLSLTILYTVIFGAVVSLGYAILYNLVGPPKYGPQDAAPPKIKVKPYKR